MPSSSIAQAVLGVLERADRLLTTNHVTRQLHRGGLKVSEVLVEQCLAQDLSDQVKKVHGRWALRAEQTPPGETVPRSGEDEDNAEDDRSMRALAREITAVLEDADLPLKARHIAALLMQRGFRVDESTVSQCLHQHLDGRVKRDGRARWLLRGEDGAPKPPQDPLAQAIVRALEAGDGPLPTNVVVTRLSAEGIAASSPDVAAALFGLKEDRHIERDEEGRWYLQDTALAARMSAPVAPSLPSLTAEEESTPESAQEPLLREKEPTTSVEKLPEPATEEALRSVDDESAVEDVPSEDAPTEEATKERVFRLLAGAPSALNSSDVAKQLAEDGTDVERSVVVEHLYQLRKEERVLVDRRFRWHAAQGGRTAFEKQAPPDGEKAEPIESIFFEVAPSGHVAQVTADLEHAKQIALVLELSPKPLRTSEIAQLFSEMSVPLAEDEAKRLFVGPLQPYVQKKRGGWVLRPPRAPQEPLPDPPDRAAGAEETLAAQTRADGMQYAFAPHELDGLAFFDAVQEGPAVTRIRLNAGHPAYALLQTALNVGTAETDPPHHLLREAQRALRLLLVGWARYEANLDEPLRRKAQRARGDWSRSVRRIVRRHEQQRDAE